MDAADRPRPRGKMRRAAYNARRLAGIDPAALQRAANRRTGGPEPGSAEGRWVPIGPSVVLGGEYQDEPRYSGRIKDIAVDATGVRAYAAAAMGGVWYTGDGGATWAPVGGWAVTQRLPGGVVNGLTCGCLLVDFGPGPDRDVVLVGTGTPRPAEVEYVWAPGGVGVLAAIGPAVSDAVSPWETATGLDVLGGAGVSRLVRDPATTPGAPGDRVLACTGRGLFVGVRGAGAYRWRGVPGLGSAAYDAAWLADGRILVVASRPESGTRLVVADLDGGEPTELTLPMAPNTFDVLGRSTKTNQGDVVAAEYLSLIEAGCLARAGGERFYLLGLVGGWLGNEYTIGPSLWRIDDPAAGPASVEQIRFAPSDDWGDSPANLRVIAVDTGAADTVYVGGTSAGPGAQLFRCDVAEGMFVPEYLGTRVHPDLQAVRLTGSLERRQVWVATDGGIFVSVEGGADCTYMAANTGIAALEPEFARSHPGGQLVVAGTQDNGTDARAGDTTWEMYAAGDGGGLAFLPHAPNVLVYQYTNAYWGTGWQREDFVDPMTRTRGWPTFPGEFDRITDAEFNASNFYSGAAVVPLTPDDGPPASRLAIGTNRVWVTDDLPAAPDRPNTWRVLPYPGGREYDPRAEWTADDPVFDQGFGSPGLGPLFTLAWASPDELIAMFDGGVVRWSAELDDTGRTWRTRTWTRADGPWHAQVEFTDLCPIPGSSDFYVTTNGIGDDYQRETVWLVSDAGLKPRVDGRAPVPVARPTGFADQHSGPRDPAFAVVLHPDAPAIVFVGTVTGVWRGVRSWDGTHEWTPYGNGLPQAIVQDLHVWADRDSRTFLLRAALASRGLWEVDLGADARRETWIRATQYDDRRGPLARDTDPWRPAEADPPDTLTASPDIVVRPAWPAAEPPPFPGDPTRDPRPDIIADRRRRNRTERDAQPLPNFDLWTFQTAFRWQHPGVPASGFFGRTMTNFLPPSGTDETIDATIWDAVVGTRIGDDGPLAVFRPPWQTAIAPDVPATEADLAELVVPANGDRSDWAVYPVPSTVEVLLHHRDSRPVPPGDAAATLLWHPFEAGDSPMDADPAGILACLTGTGGLPPGWRTARRELAVALDARLPRAVAIDVDLSDRPPGSTVLFLAYVESAADDLPRRPPSVDHPATLTELVRSWPSLAARQVRIIARRPPPSRQQPRNGPLGEPDEGR